VNSNPAKGPMVPAEPVGQHIRTLMAAGISVDRISRHTGISSATISRTIYLRQGKRRPTIRTANAVALLAVAAEDIVPGRVNATGTHRRIQALAAAGWPLLVIGREMGMHPQYMHFLLQRDGVYGSTAQRTAQTYNRLWNVAPESTGVSRLAAAQTRAWAARQGWVLPAAWDDDTIDDPAAQPEQPAEMDRRELAAYRRQEIAHLASFGIPEHDIAARLGVSDSTVQQQIRDMRKAA